MSLFIFVCFVLLGVEAGSEKIFKLQHAKGYSNVIESNKILTDPFKEKHYMENEDIDNNVESKLTHSFFNFNDILLMYFLLLFIKVF